MVQLQQFPMEALRQVQNLLGAGAWYAGEDHAATKQQQQDGMRPEPVHPHGWRPDASGSPQHRVYEVQALSKQSTLAIAAPMVATYPTRACCGGEESPPTRRGLLRPGSTFDLAPTPSDKVAQHTLAEKMEMAGRNLWTLLEAFAAPHASGFPWCNQVYQAPGNPQSRRTGAPPYNAPGAVPDRYASSASGTRSWCIRTSPSVAHGAEGGGCPSVRSGSVAEGSSERRLSPREIDEALGTSGTSASSYKGNKESSPNQDRAICISMQGGAGMLLSLFDGHGELGHSVSDLCAELMPKLVLRELDAAQAMTTGARNPQEAEANSDTLQAMTNAFLTMHAYLEALTAQHMSANDKGPTGLFARESAALVDSRVSGTTATVIMVTNEPRLLVGHVGDSRAVLGVAPRGHTGTWRTMELTRDHKPNLVEEQTRIEEAGAQVVKKGTEMQSIYRVYTPSQTWPSINMSRSLGDLHAHTQGLIATPDVNVADRPWDPVSEEAVVIIGSDGVWDVMPPQTVVEVAASARASHQDPADAICAFAYKRWMAQGLQGQYSDDITAVVKFL